jgi:large subunit ribosomal protein L2
MTFKKYKPITSSQRHLTLLNKFFLNKSPLIKSKIFGLINSSGRNNQGKITVRHKGGGIKHKYRKICFKRNYNTTGVITSLEYDPNRTAYIASVYDIFQKFYYYILASINLNVGDIVKSGVIANVKLGHTLQLKHIPIGSFIHCISDKSNKAKFMDFFKLLY